MGWGGGVRLVWREAIEGVNVWIGGRLAWLEESMRSEKRQDLLWGHAT